MRLRFYFSIFFVIFAFFLTIFLNSANSISNSSLWNGYETFYVSRLIAKNKIENILLDSGVFEFVCEENQRLPLYSKFSPIQAQSEDSYIFRRTGFFYDESGEFCVYYVPKKFSQKIPRVLSKINSDFSADFSSDSTICGFFSGKKQSFLPFLISILAFFCGAFFSKNRSFFCVSSVFMLFFVFKNPFFCTSLCAILTFFSIFVFQRVNGRSGFEKLLLSSPFFLLPIIFGIILSFAAGIKTVFFYIIAIFACVAFAILFFELKRIREKTQNLFVPVPILSAKKVGIIGKSGKKFLCLNFLLVFLIFLIFIFRNSFFLDFSLFEKKSFEVLLPAPVSARDATLPNLKDFSFWAWKTLTFPFKNLKTDFENPREGEKFSFEGIAQNPDAIFLQELCEFSFDKNFRKNLYKTAQNLDYPALEKILVLQGENTLFGYSKKVATLSENFWIFILASFFLILASGIAIFYLEKIK